MNKLLTFESFVPKNLEKRAKDLEIKHVKELKEYETFLIRFLRNLKFIQNKKSNNSQEQLFIDLIKNCKIKIDQKESPFKIYLFQDDEYYFDYDWKNDFFLVSK